MIRSQSALQLHDPLPIAARSRSASDLLARRFDSAEPAPSPLSVERCVACDSKSPRSELALADRKSAAQMETPPESKREGFAGWFRQSAASLLVGSLKIAPADAVKIAAELEECFEERSFQVSELQGSALGVIDLARLRFQTYDTVWEMRKLRPFNDLMDNYAKLLGTAGCFVDWADRHDRQLYFPDSWPVDGQDTPFPVEAHLREALVTRMASLMRMDQQDAGGIADALLSGFCTVNCEASKERLNVVELTPLRDYLFETYEDESADQILAEVQGRMGDLLRDDAGPRFPGFVKVRMIVPAD